MMSKLTTHTATTKAAPADLSDESLLAGILVDDASCWEEFFRRYDRLIYRCITRVTGRFSRVVTHEDVREIYSSVVVNLLRKDKRKLRRFDPERGSKLSSWLGLISVNTTYDYLRMVARQPLNGGITEADERPATGLDPFEQLAVRERLGHIAVALRGFSEKDRLFVALYYLEEKPPEEIAAIMGISVKTVYTKKHKLRCRLSERLAEQVPEAIAA